MQWEEKNANQEYTQERKRKLMVFTGDYITLHGKAKRANFFLTIRINKTLARFQV